MTKERIKTSFNKPILIATAFVVALGGFFVANPVKAVLLDPVMNEVYTHGASEWVEILNPNSSGTINLNGYKFLIGGTDMRTINKDIFVPAQDLATVGNSDFTEGSLVLHDTTDSILFLKPDGVTGLGTVSYGGYGQPTAPNASQSLSFDGVGSYTVQTSTKGWFNSVPTIASIISGISAAGVTTNWGTIPDSSVATGLYFEKTGAGRVTFNATLNLTDSATAALLQDLGNKMTASAGSMKFDARTASQLKTAGAEIKMYGLPTNANFTSSSLVVKDDTGVVIPPTIDGVPNPDYPTISGFTFDGPSGTATFTASHFTQFDLQDKSNVYVDATKSDSNDGLTAETAKKTISAGIALVNTGGTVHVAAGSYTEQITINKSLDLIGAGKATTTIVAPDTRLGSVSQTVTGDPIVHDYLLATYATSNTIDVRVEGFTFNVNGKNKTAGTGQMDGVFFRDVKDAGGTVAGLFASTIHNFSTTPDYEAFGVVVYGDSLLTLDTNDIHDYTRDGISINRKYASGAVPNVTISNNIVTGSALPLNGINIDTVSAGSITGNTVTANTRSGPWAAGGIVAWASTGITISSNHVNGNFYGIDLEPGTSGVTISGNDLADNVKRAISLNSANNNTVSGNTINGPAGGTDDVAIGLANTSTGNIIGGNSPADGNTITMATSGAGNLYAIYMQSDVGTGANTIKYNTITGGQRAVQFDGPPGITGATTVANNTISSQAFGGILAYNNGNLTITDNTLTNTVRPMEFYGPHDLIITGNTINGATNDGINLGSATGTINIAGNHISNVASENTYAIHTRSGADSVTIDNNEIYDSFIGVYVDTGSTGDQITNNNIHNNTFGAASIHEVVGTITGNTFTNNQRGIEADHSITIQNNSITADANTDYCQLCLYANATYHASQNWWGTNDPTEIAGWIVDNGFAVDYSPWWGANYVGDSHATAWSWYTNSSIANAINTATAGDTVNVVDGTYIENLIINKALTLDGQSRTGTIIDAGLVPGAIAVVVTANDVTLKDLHLQARPAVAQQRGLSIPDGNVVHNLTLNNVNITGAVNRYGIEVLGQAWNLSVIDSLFSNNTVGIMIGDQGLIDGLTLTGSSFDHGPNTTTTEVGPVCLQRF